MLIYFQTQEKIKPKAMSREHVYSSIILIRSSLFCTNYIIMRNPSKNEMKDNFPCSLVTFNCGKVLETFGLNCKQRIYKWMDFGGILKSGILHILDIFPLMWSRFSNSNAQLILSLY
jgi:hypothetical protein